MSFFYVNRDCEGKLSPLPASPYLLPAIAVGGILAGLGKLLKPHFKPYYETPEFIHAQFKELFGDNTPEMLEHWRECSRDYRRLLKYRTTDMLPWDKERWHYIQYQAPWCDPHLPYALYLTDNV